VENRVNVIRAANTGFSCFINPSGEVTAAVESHGRRLFVDGVASADIVLSRTPTAYTLYGDVFAYACMAFLASCALVRPGKV
jgi:apolipoprotein N-acyltransferase